MSANSEQRSSNATLYVSVAAIERAAIRAIESQDFEAADILLDILRALDEEARLH